MGGLLNSVIASVTGVDANTLSADLNAAEQYAVAAAEIFALLIVIIVFELAFILFELRAK